MDWLGPNWRAMLSLDQPVLEPVFRGVLIYSGLFVLMRVVPRREAGTISLSDLLLVNLVVEAVSNGLQGEGKSVPAAFLTATTTLFCAYAADWMSYHWRWFRQATEPSPKPLVRDGKLRPRALQEELITRDELESLARKEGQEGLAQVRHATLEPDGQISVIPKKRADEEAPPPESPRRQRRPRGDALERLWAMQRKLEAQQARIATLLQEMMLQPPK